MTVNYDRLAVGDRLRLKRTLLGLTQEDIARKIGRAPKYYADIERGSCGMSVETLMALANTFNMSLDYIIYGKENDTKRKYHEDEVYAIIDILNNASEKKRSYAIKLLQLFLAACDG